MAERGNWPNTFKSAEKYFGIDWDAFLINEGDNINTISWDVPAEFDKWDGTQWVTGDTVDNDAGSDYNILQLGVSNVTKIKLRANKVGTYTITCWIGTTDASQTQLIPQTMVLKII